ncbi:MAG: epimerase, partial [Nocardioidaceae bacterium]|nr:epimerase [Nocardioidaceae bacterium]
ITTLRMANILSPRVVSPFSRYFESPILPTVIGYDPRLQFTHELDAMALLGEAVVRDRPGIFNVAGDGVMLLSQIARRLGKPTLPLPFLGLSSAFRRVLKSLGTDVPPELARLLTYGRVLDTSALADVFGYTMSHSTEETFDDFAKSLRPGIFAKLGGGR